MSDAFDHGEFRTVLGNFATGVVIVTATGPSAPVGMTIGAFTSVSLAPPLIAFLPAKTSETWPRIQEASTFTINILSNGQEALCRAFARTSDQKFDGVAWTQSAHGSPHIGGALAWLDCELTSVFEAGDHDIAIGTVKSITRGEDAEPLVFYKGKFHGVVPNEVAASA